MSPAARVRKISGLAVLADASKRLGDVAHDFAVSQLHRRAQRDATQQLLALIVSPEGQAALQQIEAVAAAADQQALIGGAA